MFSRAFAQICLASTVLAAAVAPHYVEHERRDHVHHENIWSRGERLHGSQMLPFRIGLTQQNLDKGHELLMAISDPKSDKYGQHWSEDEVVDFFAPHEDSVSSVREWLIKDGGFDPERITISQNKQWVQIDATTEEIESLLQTEYHVYHHQENGKRSIATDRYHVPHHIRDHVDYVTPGVRLLQVDTPKTQRKRDVASYRSPLPYRKPLPEHLKKPGVLDSIENCDKIITPACLRAMYNFTEGTTAVDGNSIGVYESFGESYTQRDLNVFFSNLTKIANGTHPDLVRIDGGIGPGSPGGECELDLDCVYPIVHPQKVTLYEVDDKHYNRASGSIISQYDGLFNTFLDAIDGSYCSYKAFGISGNTAWPDHNFPHMDPVYPDKHKGGYKGELQCGKFEPTNVISVSYSLAEFFTPMNYQRRQCNEYLKLGMQGVSVVMSTGDNGVANIKYIGDDGCLWAPGDVHGNQTNFPIAESSIDSRKPVFNPGFPVTCPYVTTVGATALLEDADVHADAEVASTQFGSAGGFSNIYPIPDYQKTAVSDFFKNSPPPYEFYETTYNQSFSPNGGLYNRAGRGFPDVAANGQNTAVGYFGSISTSGGTSASAPIFAAILTRINEERIQAGKKPVGFVNPALYSHPHVLHDITEGNNGGCNSHGFNATAGWDPVTGLGTPDFPAMLDMFMSLP